MNLKKLLFLLFTFNTIFSIEINCMKRKNEEESSDNKKTKTDNNNDNDNDPTPQFFDKLLDGDYNHQIEDPKTDEEIEQEKKLEALKKDQFEQYKQEHEKEIIKDSIKDSIIDAIKNLNYNQLQYLLEKTNCLNCININDINIDNEKDSIDYLTQYSLERYLNAIRYDEYFKILEYLISHNSKITIKNLFFFTHSYDPLFIDKDRINIMKNNIDIINHKNQYFKILQLLANKIDNLNETTEKKYEILPLLATMSQHEFQFLDLIIFLIESKNANINREHLGNPMLAHLMQNFLRNKQDNIEICRDGCKEYDPNNDRYINIIKYLISKKININSNSSNIAIMPYLYHINNISFNDHALMILAKGDLLQEDINQNKYLCTKFINKPGYCTIVKLLIEAGIDVFAKNEEGYCALYNPKIKEIYDEYYKNKIIALMQSIENAERYFPEKNILPVIANYVLPTIEEIEALPFNKPIEFGGTNNDI